MHFIRICFAPYTYIIILYSSKKYCTCIEVCTDKIQKNVHCNARVLIVEHSHKLKL